MRQSLGMITALRMRDSQHVQSVVVVRVFVAYEAQVSNCVVVAAFVDRQRGGIQTLVDRLGRGSLGRGLAATNVQVEPHAFVELLLLREAAQHRFEELLGFFIAMALDGLNALLVDRYGFDVGRAAR